MLTRSLIPWSDLTRQSMPQFEICRRPMVVQGRELAVGDPLPVELFANRVRIRQLYDGRLIQPVTPPPGSVQAAVVAKTAVTTVTTVTTFTPELPAPIATGEYAGPIEVTVDVPVMEEYDRAAEASPRPAYIPSRSRKRKGA
jgi:hypothetical protein